MTGSSPSSAGQERDRANRYAAAVYGSIVSAALIAPFREEHASSETAALVLISTMAVFWAAHVWSGIMGERLHHGGALEVEHIRARGREQLPLLEATLGPVIALLLGWIGAISDETAATLALAVCLAELFAWGVAVGWRAYAHWWAPLLAGAVNLTLGGILISLEVAVFQLH